MTGKFIQATRQHCGCYTAARYLLIKAFDDALDRGETHTARAIHKVMRDLYIKLEIDKR